MTGGAICNREDIDAFVECAYDYVMDNGTEASGRALREDERCLGDLIYAFVDQQAPTGSEAMSYAFPPDPSRELQARGLLVDEFGADEVREATHIVNILGWEPPRHLYRV